MAESLSVITTQRIVNRPRAANQIQRLAIGDVSIRITPRGRRLQRKWHIGTIGFSYADWRNVFYPQDCRPADFLAAYSTALDSLELDTIFHALPTAERVQ